MRATGLRRAALSALGLAFAWVVFAGCLEREGAAPYLAKAEELFAAGKLDDALIELRHALKAEPKNAEVNFQMAKLLARQQNYPDAVFFFEEALRLDPRHADAALTLAFLMLRDDLDYATRLVDGVIERDPKNSLAWVRRSDVALARGDADAALVAALTAVEIAPEDARTRIQLGLVHRARIRSHRALKQEVPESLYADALAAFERVSPSARNPSEREVAIRARVEIANTLASWPARAGEAPAAYRNAFALAEKLGGSQDLALDAALAYSQRMQDEELEKWVLESGIALHPERLPLWRRLAQATEPPGATSSPTFERLVNVRPRDARAHALYARDLAARGRGAEATAHLEKVVDGVDEPAFALLAQVELASVVGEAAKAEAAAARLATAYPGSLQDRLAKAELLRRARKFGPSADALEGAIDAYGATAALQTRVAEARLLAGDSAAALEAAAAGLSLATTAQQKLVLLRIQARAQIARGALEAAAASFGRMQAIAGGKVASSDLVPYAQALYASGKEQGARSLLESALSLVPPPVEAVILYSRREGAQDRVRAEKLVAEALTRTPHHPTLLEEAARIDLAAGRGQLARDRLKTALEAAPDYAALHVALARVQLQLGDAQGAVASAENALRLEPNSPHPMAARVLVAAYTKLGKAEEAVQRLETAHRGGTLGLGGQVLLGQLLMRRGEQERAIAVLEAIAKAAPELAGPKNDLAYLLISSGRDLDRALSMAQEARAALPNIGSVADTLGFAYLAKQLPEAALPQFEEAISLAETGSAEWGLAQLHRAQALVALGRSGDARAAAEAALTAAKFPEQESAREVLAALPRAG